MKAPPKPKYKANRKSIRAPVVPKEINGLLTRQKEGRQAPFLIWDVSEFGLGLWSAERLEQGEVVKVTVGEPFPLIIDCKVKWCASEAEHEGFRCGLEVEGSSKQLESLYQTFMRMIEKE